MNNWSNVDWKNVVRNIERLQDKITKAAKADDWNSVASFQRILVNSLDARLMAVKTVTSSPGRKTPGIDGITWVSDGDKMDAVKNLKNATPTKYVPKPVKRVLIPKGKTGGMRPIGIPTMFDRAMQALYNLALVPLAELRADANSFGFRKGRSPHDAVQTLFGALNPPDIPKLVLDADIKGLFDNISHDWILANIPLNSTVLEKLKAGFIDLGKFYENELGVPQGGIISPTIANMALDGLEPTIFNALVRNKVRVAKFVRVVRYADDFVVVAPYLWIIDKVVKPVISDFLAERGLELNAEKTKN